MKETVVYLKREIASLSGRLKNTKDTLKYHQDMVNMVQKDVDNLTNTIKEMEAAIAKLTEPHNGIISITENRKAL